MPRLADAPTTGAWSLATARRLLARRVVAHTVGVVVAALILWLAWQGYRQPELLIDFANARLC